MQTVIRIIYNDIPWTFHDWDYFQRLSKPGKLYSQNPMTVRDPWGPCDYQSITHQWRQWINYCCCSDQHPQLTAAARRPSIHHTATTSYTSDRHHWHRPVSVTVIIITDAGYKQLQTYPPDTSLCTCKQTRNSTNCYNWTKQLTAYI